MGQKGYAGAYGGALLQFRLPSVERDSGEDPDSWAWLRLREMWVDQKGWTGRGRCPRSPYLSDLWCTQHTGASTKERKDAIEAKALEAEKKSKKKAKKIRSTEIAYGWYKDANGWWYIEEDGNWHSNEWKNTNGTWSYLDADGYAKTGWFTVDGIWYYAGADGTLFVNTVTPDGYHVNGDGAWVWSDHKRLQKVSACHTCLLCV